MLLRLSKDRLRKGMFVEAVECPDSFFAKRRFLLENEEDLRAILETPAQYVLVNLTRGRFKPGPAEPGFPSDLAKPQGNADVDRKAEAKKVVARSVTALRQSLNGLLAGEAPDLTPLQPVVGEMVQADSASTNLVIEVTRLKSKDEGTFQHSLAVSALMSQLGHALDLQRDMIELLVLGGFLHDVGKLLIPNAILKKAGTLSDAERAIIRGHPENGYHLLLRDSTIPKDVLEICRYHHEYLDGSGYPHGLKAADLSPLVRISTVCDVFDALTSVRPYKKPWTTGQAIEWLYERNKQFDRKLVLRLASAIDAA